MSTKIPVDSSPYSQPHFIINQHDDDESDGVEEDQVIRGQIPLVSEEAAIGAERGYAVATSYVSQALPPTAPVFIPVGETPIPDSPAVMSTVLSPTGPVFIPAEQIPIPANGHTYSRGLSATAPIFVPNVPNNVPYLLCVADTSRSVRRQGCLNQSLEQIDIVRQVEMDARRKHFEYVVDWMWSPNSDLLVSTDRT
ncbi:hypothetical protein IFR04_009111 [Cadophora malorum]|uniref:Uncharacterized protein n=1 Tax=Cadophora malorum TaxID=108018 RepID=A0A8H7TDN3_9HELO|nr:hypothetical protein IFR04_009111 [Cadophora malorum]